MTEAALSLSRISEDLFDIVASANTGPAPCLVDSLKGFLPVNNARWIVEKLGDLAEGKFRPEGYYYEREGLLEIVIFVPTGASKQEARERLKESLVALNSKSHN